jgi:hypothetical protein
MENFAVFSANFAGCGQNFPILENFAVYTILMPKKSVVRIFEYSNIQIFAVGDI